ncbi:histidine kinase dimerization/phospho-acceptor domain-containing protein [Jhaorihella thermophila]
MGGPEELQRLTRAFNEMQDRIRRFVDDRTQLLAALGHDLRSPLTALRVRAEMVDDDETRERLVASIEEMQQMVEATLSFARGMAESEPAETVDLGDYVGALCAEMAEAGEEVTFIAPRGGSFGASAPGRHASRPSQRDRQCRALWWAGPGGGARRRRGGGRG